MTDGGEDFNLGHVVGDTGEKGDDGSTLWNTSTAPTYANSKYTFNISNLSGKTGLEIAVNDIIFYSTYYYIVSAVNTTTVDCSTRVSIKGSDATVTIATSFGSTPSDSKVPSEKLTKNTLDTKVDKVTGKGLSTNDFTNSYKNTIDGLSTVATTGDYDDLTDKPTIPSKISDLTNDSDFIETSSTSGLIKNDGTIDTTSYSTFSGSYNDLSNKPTIPSKTSDLTNDGADGTNVFVANNDSRLSDARTPTSHTHGNLTNDGKVGSTANYFVYTTTSGAITSKQKIGNITISGAIGSTANKPLITTTNGVITTGSFGTSANSFCEGNDSRLSDARTPTAHTHTVSNITDFPTIPTKISDLTNDSDFIEKSSTSGLIKNDGTIDTNSYLTSSALSNYVQKSNTSGLLKNDGSVMTSGTGASNYSAGNHTHSGYASSTHGHGYIYNDGKVDYVFPVDFDYENFGGVLGVFYSNDDSDYAKIIPTTFMANKLIDGSAYSNIGTSANASQQAINSGINTVLGNKLSATKVISWSSTPSDSNVPSEKLVSDTFDAIEDLIGDAIAYINQ